MLGMGPMEIAVIVIVALIIFGPGKLPEIGQTIGRAVRDFRSATQDITGDFKQTMDELQETADDFKNSAMEFQQEAEDTISDAQTGLYQAAKDIEDTTAEVTSDVNENLSLDQMESPATRPSSKTEESIAAAREEYRKSASTGKKATTKSKSSGASAKVKSASRKSGKSTDKPGKSTRTASSAKKKASSRDDRPAKGRKRRERQPAAVSASSSPSKEDPLADLMGVDDGPITSSRSRGNGRRRASA